MSNASSMQSTPVVHKRARAQAQPKVSIVLLDWTCRERLHTLDWLAKQTVPRSDYELIWVELFDRVLPEVRDKCDVVITCGQRGLYHKHLGYNVGVLHAKGQVVTICDSDACFPPEFVGSVITAFELDQEPKRQVLMHHQWRTGHTYPDDLHDVEGMSRYRWRKLWPNVGACMSTLRADIVRFGGFDEHHTYGGYMCGPYDLGWRLTNAGLPEIWHDQSVALWHFAHPDPWFSAGELFSWKRWREKAYPHVDGHALTAVEGFSTGRMLPLQENPHIHRLRMDNRTIGTPFEEHYASLTGPRGFTRTQRLRMQADLWKEPLQRVYKVAKERVKRYLSPADSPRRKTPQEFWLADPPQDSAVRDSTRSSR